MYSDAFRKQFRPVTLYRKRIRIKWQFLTVETLVGSGVFDVRDKLLKQKNRPCI